MCFACVYACRPPAESKDRIDNAMCVCVCVCVKKNVAHLGCACAVLLLRVKDGVKNRVEKVLRELAVREAVHTIGELVIACTHTHTYTHTHTHTAQPCAVKSCCSAGVTHTQTDIQMDVRTSGPHFAGLCSCALGVLALCQAGRATEHTCTWSLRAHSVCSVCVIACG